MTTSTTATKRADEDKQSVDVNPNTIKHLRQHGGGEDDDDGDGDGEKWSSRQEGVHASTIGNNNGEEPDAAAASSPTLELTRASGRFQSHPGAYAVAGPGGDGSGDDTTGFEEQSTSRQLEGGDMEDALEAEVHDEEAVRTRVHDRVEQRIRNQAVCATNVRTVVDNSGATDGIDIDNGKDDNLDNSGKNNNGLWERYKAPMMLFGLGALALLLVVAMVVFLSSSNKTYDDPPPLNEETTASNDEANEVSLSDEQYLVNILKTVSNETLLLLDDDFAGSTTPQYKAMRWLVDANDPSILDVQSVVDEQTIIERYSLAVLYFSTDGINSWDPITKDYFLSNATSVCEWNDGVDIGVFCNEERHVKEITMTSVGLNGTLPRELRALSRLTKLDFGVNQLFGTIPSDYGHHLSVLEYFGIHYNQVSGSLPNSLSKLSELETFFAGVNALTGPIPSEFFQLPSLQFCSLAFNQLTGTIPEFNPNMPLSLLWLDLNLLEGTIPPSLYNVPALASLWLGFNNLVGSISTEVGKMKPVEYLDFSWNGFSGTLPSEIASLTDLLLLYLNNNDMTGTIPSTYGKLDRLQHIGLSFNKLNGGIPEEFGDLSSLEGLVLNSNELTGSVPTVVAALPSLAYLNVSNTSLAEDALDHFCNQSDLVVDIHADCLGEVPEVHCPCCSACYDDATGDFDLNLFQVCSMLAIEDSNEVDRGVHCDCSGDGQMLSCDESCQSCNTDRTICTVNSYDQAFDDTGVWLSTKSTFQYVKGLNATVTFEYSPSEVGSGLSCSVSVDGEACDGCSYNFCTNNEFVTIQVSCDNVQGLGNYFSCTPGIEDEDFGPLTVFALQDPFLLDGCPPVFVHPRATAEYFGAYGR